MSPSSAARHASMRSPSSRPRLRAGFAAGALGLAAAATSLATPATAATASPAAAAGTYSASALPAGAIKHVWLIIEENKSYDATFTGLNKNSYLWQTLPSQGVLLKNYYGTGHFSQDNYEALVAGQAPEQDTQSDCDVAATNFSTNRLTDFSGSNTSNVNYGQSVSAAGPNAKDGKNGCVYPTAAPTLFNQLDAAGKTWKGYAQDLGDQTGRDDGPCGYPGTTSNSPDTTVDPATTGASTSHSDSTALNGAKYYPGVASFTGVQAAGNDAAGKAGAVEDGYVAKHFPFPWFHSLTDQNTTVPVGGGKDCDVNHVANLDGPPSASSKYQGSSLVSDLQSEATTPNFSWITPNNCSDAHDAVCKGNNLSGAFNADGTPNYQTGGSKPFDPQGSTPKNFTGGLYASDLFLKWYVPLIEQSPAFKDGGLIDITFDEGNAPFSNSSFNNANDPAFASNEANPPAHDIPAGAGNLLQTALATDNAGENINGNNVNTEPAGPNTPFTQNTASSTNPTDANSTCPSTQAATLPCPGPGDKRFHRPVCPGRQERQRRECCCRRLNHQRQQRCLHRPGSHRHLPHGPDHDVWHPRQLLRRPGGRVWTAVPDNQHRSRPAGLVHARERQRSRREHDGRGVRCEPGRRDGRDRPHL